MAQPDAPACTVRRADYRNADDAAALVALLDAYARDPMGGGAPLPEATRATLCQRLADTPGTASWLAWALPNGTGTPPQPVGLLNSLMGFSTFKAQPLLNVHDIAVLPGWRGRGIGQQLLEAAQAHALAQGCCKLTLEVLSGNAAGRAAYRRFGFENYTLDPAAGQAMFMQKWL